MTKIAIKVNNVSKMYKLYTKPVDRFKEALGLSKKKLYHEHYALNSINFMVNTGETVGIIGTNGSGKSTILKIITGVLNATDGVVEVNGRISALLELGAGFNPEYTGLENIYLNGTMIGFSKEDIDNKLKDIISFADIGDFIYQPVKTYSSGMFVRLAFAVAISINPEILVVDEALSVGDVFFQAKCYKKFEEFKNQGKTILFVSHDLSSVSKYCDRVILLDKGKLIGEGRPKEMIDMYKRALVNQLGVQTEKSIQVEKNIINIEHKWKEAMNINPNTLDYGSKLAEIVDFCIEDHRGLVTNTILKGKNIIIKMKIHFNEDIQNPIFAFTIKDLKGTEITGTNTLLEKANIGIIKKNEIKQAEFSQEINLQGGEYLLSLGCTGYREGEFTVYHRLYDVCSITVVSEKNTVGLYDTNSIVLIK